MSGDAIPRPADLAAQLLKKGYTNAVRQVVGAIASEITPGGILHRRLQQFDDHARELAADGQRVAADDPVLRALLADFGVALRRQAGLIDAAAPGVGATGIDAAGQFFRQTTLPGMSDQQAAAVGIRFNQPDPEAVAAAVNYTGGAAWENELRRYQEDIGEQVRQIALRGIVAGRGPLAIANDLRGAVEGIPAYRANALMRTLQLQSFRVGAAVHQTENASILSHQIRIAALDNRTCLCCVSEHGKIMPLGEVIQDHHQGRCTSIAVVRGNPRTVQTGEAWFSGLPEERQRAIAGPGAFEALRRGDVRLGDFVQPYEDAVFGDMIRQGSLSRAIEVSSAATVETVYGIRRRERGNVPTDVNGLGDWLIENEDTFLAEKLLDPNLNLFETDFSQGFRRLVNVQGVRDAAKAFVRESQDIQYGRDYLLDLVIDLAGENGVRVGNREAAARLLNEDYATQARAILTAAGMGNVRLTAAQQRRINESLQGNYLDLVYTTESSTRGSLANQTRSTGGGGVMTDAERRDRRRQFLSYINGLDL